MGRSAELAYKYSLSGLFGSKYFDFIFFKSLLVEFLCK